MRSTMEMISAVRPESSEGTQYRVTAKRGEIGSQVLLPGDPDRMPKIARF